MAANPKPTRKVRTTSARTPDGKKVSIQKSSKTLKNIDGKKYKDGAVVSRDGSKPIDKKTNERYAGKEWKDTYSVSTKQNPKTGRAQNLGEMKKTVRKGNFPIGFEGEGKAKAPANKNFKEGPSFKKKKP
jgi:hypothetical protein